MDKKHFQRIADLAMPSIVKGPSSYGQADPAKDIIATAKRQGNSIVRAVQYPDAETALAARRPGVTGLGMRFEYPDGTVRDKFGRIINEEKE